METIHAIIDSERLAPIMELPESFRHREVEVVVFARLRDESAAAEKPASRADSLMGSLAQYANPKLRKLEKKAWERAAVEKERKRMKRIGKKT